jgi:hypothetical protein
VRPISYFQFPISGSEKLGWIKPLTEDFQFPISGSEARDVDEAIEKFTFNSLYRVLEKLKKMISGQEIKSFQFPISGSFFGGDFYGYT